MKMKIQIFLLVLCFYAANQQRVEEKSSESDQEVSEESLYDSESENESNETDGSDSSSNESNTHISQAQSSESSYDYNDNDYSREMIGGNYTSKCKENEVFNSCTNSGCVPQKCSQLGYPVPCIRLDPRYCQKGCTCKEGYLRTENGTCVLKENCGTPCGGDSNAVPGCGTNCGRHCSNIGQGPVACKQICNPNGCDCKPGFVLDDDTNKCVRPIQCTRICKTNEVYSSCVNGGCDRRNCSQLNQPQICKNIISSACIAGCVCRKGYLRNRSGLCVPENQCPEEACPTNEIFNTCAPPFDPVCISGKIVTNDNVSITLCQGRCTCKPGFIRNINGECISKANCRRCNGPYEYYSCGGACDNVCATLSTQNQTNCPIVNVKCNEMCYCEKGYARDKNNICIPINNCPVINCRDNEVFSKCKKTCPPDTCISLVAKFKCDSREPCKPGCRCKDGYLRAKDGAHCMPIKKCPQLAKASN